MPDFDAVVVGSGIAGALVARELGRAGKKVLILEAGRAIPPDINSYMQRFFLSTAKVPESPYPPEFFSGGDMVDPARLNAGRPTSLMLGPWTDPRKSYLVQKGPLPFGSTYERVGGGTAVHWLGTSLRFLPNDFKMKSTFNKFDDWPISYSDLDKDKDNSWYGKAEHSIGVSADVGEQEYLGINFAGGYKYPMPALPDSMTDQFMSRKINNMSIDGVPVKVRITPAARNSQPFDLRRVCAGNTNCIPICPIQAKYDPTITVNEALRTGNVEIRYRSVASEVLLGENGRVSGVKYREYVEDSGPNIEKSVTATVVVLAANAIETPKLLLMSTNEGKLPNGVGNSSGKLGRYLMDHPYHVTWGLVREQVWPYRGPLSTSGIEDLRDAKRSERGAFRVEIGNEGWNFVVAGSKKGGDPNVTTLDFINGLNNTGLNKDKKALFGKDLTKQLNDVITRQIRLGFLIEQEPEEKNRIELSGQFKDNLGLPRPQITYDLSDYTKAGIAAARQASDEIFKQLNAEPFTTAAEPQDSNSFEWPLGSKSRLNYLGAGHIMGTYRMGTTKDNSVVDREQRSWDHKNLFMVGSGVFPTVGTANPTLTIAALSLWAADTILKTELKG